jgi:hypothetical protein
LRRIAVSLLMLTINMRHGRLLLTTNMGSSDGRVWRNLGIGMA